MSATFHLYELAVRHCAIAPHGNQFLLIDASGLPNLRKMLRNANWCGLLESTPSEHVLAEPVLVSTVTAGKIQVSKTFCAWLSSSASNTSTVSVISSPLTLAELRGRLLLRTHGRLCGDVEILLRFFDPRVFESLLSILTIAQLNTFCAVAETWGYINRQGEFIEHSAVFARNDPFVAPLLIDQEQEDKLIGSAMPDNILNVMRENASEIMRSIPFDKQYIRVKDAYELAQDDKVEDVHAAILYIATILINGVEHRKSSEWPEFLQKLKSGDALV